MMGDRVNNSAEQYLSPGVHAGRLLMTQCLQLQTPRSRLDGRHTERSEREGESTQCPPRPRPRPGYQRMIQGQGESGIRESETTKKRLMSVFVTGRPIEEQ